MSKDLQALPDRKDHLDLWLDNFLFYLHIYSVLMNIAIIGLEIAVLILSSSSPPAGTSWFARSSWRPRCQGREGTSRSYWSHWTTRRAGREGRPRYAWPSGIQWTQRRDCKSDFYHLYWRWSTSSAIIFIVFDNNILNFVCYYRECLEAQDPSALLVLLVCLWVHCSQDVWRVILIKDSNKTAVVAFIKLKSLSSTGSSRYQRS